MVNINIILFGKLREKYLKEASEEYEKRLKGYCKLKIHEYSPAKISENPSEKEIASALSAEAKIISQFYSEKNTYNIAMCIEGENLSSEKLAEKMEKITVNGTATINFVIGSSFGISDEIKKASDYKLSMSKMTFPHRLARIMLLEQIYRGFKINNGGKYHK